MNKKVLKQILKFTSSVLAILLCGMICDTLFSTLLRLIGTLARTRFIGATELPIVEQVVITLWYDFLDSREFAFIMTPIIVIAHFVLKTEQRFVRIATWFFTSIIVYQFLLPGGWSATLSRKHGGYTVLIFTGLACGIAYPHIEKFLWKALSWLHETEILTEKK